ncbi:MAG: glycosyltransferase [Planctomycetes bacterium]|nr:glycosyltransferase [Planctomycetota bacterium]
MHRDNAAPELGVVAIGRNEGERLRRCLESVRKQCAHVVYVDSGSQDGSVELARGLGVEVVELDMSRPFSAARARNEGWRHLASLRSDLEFVQFVDGDCELFPAWIETGLRTLRERADVAVVCGRRRERFREATLYNRLCDIEWNSPIGEASACGGDSLMRHTALAQVQGFDPSLVCGEEPELCKRLRERGHRILRLDADMTLHDAAMTRFSQWWRRSVRTGFGAGEALFLHGRSAPDSDRRAIRGVLVWAAAFPLLVALAVIAAAIAFDRRTALLVAAAGLVLLLAQTLRIAIGRRARGDSAYDRIAYAVFCMGGRVPQGFGMLRSRRQRRQRVAARLIEYK